MPSRRHVLAAAAAAAVVPAIARTSPASAATTPNGDVWVFGDSITLAGSIAAVGGNESWGWVQRLTVAMAGKGVTVHNFGIGGSWYTNPAPGSETSYFSIPNRVKEVFAAYPGQVPSVVILAGGTNDVGSHDIGLPDSDPRSIQTSFAAVVATYNYLISMGVQRVVVDMVYPYAIPVTQVGSYPMLPASFIPIINARIRVWNDWLMRQFSPVLNAVVVNVHEPLLGSDLQGDRNLFIDGVHPNFYGHLNIFQRFPQSTLKGV